MDAYFNVTFNVHVTIIFKYYAHTEIIFVTFEDKENSTMRLDMDI